MPRYPTSFVTVERANGETDCFPRKLDTLDYFRRVLEAEGCTVKRVINLDLFQDRAMIQSLLRAAQMAADEEGQRLEEWINNFEQSQEQKHENSEA